eukprot:TRINITY_DN64862_c0_g1_i2.p1 TRINITY_DN64862_c0_g1~~TRINITY_DN64862_c0_g1_i2.p1  ORF type:complete len:491 (+),score=67.00 TRINITY_DN64862_c0_g1_i2:74-1546(+)
MPLRLVVLWAFTGTVASVDVVTDERRELRRQQRAAARYLTVQERRKTVQQKMLQLQGYRAALEGTAREVSEKCAQLLTWQQELTEKEDWLTCLREGFHATVHEQQRNLLHLTVFRLVRTQAAAQGRYQVPQTTTMRSAETGEEVDDLRVAKASRWKKVEVVGCIPGSMDAVVDKLPVWQIFATSTPLVVRNVCEQDVGASQVVWEPLAVLRLLLVFLEAASQGTAGSTSADDTLFYVVLGANNIFNGFSSPASDAHADAVAKATVEITTRFDALIREHGRATASSVVVATASSCQEASDTSAAATLPPDCLSARGMLGSAGGLRHLARSLLLIAEQKALRLPSAPLGDLTAVNLALHTWVSEDPGHGIVPDTHGVLFGSLDGDLRGRLELDSLMNGCSSELTVKDCAVFRNASWSTQASFDGRQPISWHSISSAGRWRHLLAMQALSVACQRVAVLTLANQPLNLLEHLFDLFTATQRHAVPGSHGPLRT